LRDPALHVGLIFCAIPAQSSGKHGIKILTAHATSAGSGRPKTITGPAVSRLFIQLALHLESQAGALVRQGPDRSRHQCACFRDLRTTADEGAHQCPAHTPHLRHAHACRPDHRALRSHWCDNVAKIIDTCAGEADRSNASAVVHKSRSEAEGNLLSATHRFHGNGEAMIPPEQCDRPRQARGHGGAKA